MAIDGQALERRFTLYFDFLGTSDATTGWTIEKIHEFVDLLRELVHIRGAQEIDGAPTEDGGYKVSIRPEISTFSDHIVVSYPEFANEDERADGPLQPLWTQFVCQDCIRVVGVVAERGLRIGLLMRGALSFGELFHGEDAVFGEALVDAYHLESEVARDPRIVVSENVLGKLEGGPVAYPEIFLQDTDMRWHLNYFPTLKQGSVGMEQVDGLERWLVFVQAQIDQNLDALKAKPKKRAKWEWFDRRFRSVTWNTDTK
ncbi:MAG: hypothetical protein K8R18_08815 [Parvibaculum sp.]|uniref:hypothetical protein n=1 Tax=Parvibaculum sp. TaxID=2024848 RepID=UPI0025D492A8|nr:hypothetical protein [Parvibaculum sp.]MCE9649709.1 hypothetical protein [Parvibaculum sp.]